MVLVSGPCKDGDQCCVGCSRLCCAALINRSKLCADGKGETAFSCPQPSQASAINFSYIGGYCKQYLVCFSGLISSHSNDCNGPPLSHVTCVVHVVQTARTNARVLDAQALAWYGKCCEAAPFEHHTKQYWVGVDGRLILWRSRPATRLWPKKCLPMTVSEKHTQV